MKSVLFIALAAASACATAPTDISFQPTDQTETHSAFAPAGDDEAILIFSVGPIGTGGGYQLQRINADQTDFDGKPVALSFGAWGVGDKMKRPEHDKSSIWVLKNEINFLIKKVPAGTYAATYVTWSTYNGYASGSAWLCQDEGAPTFEVQAGKVNLLSSRDAFPPGTVTRLSTDFTEEQILAQFERTRQNYPDLKGEPVVVYPSLETRWKEKGSGLFSSPCSAAQPGSLSVSRIDFAAAGSPDAEPDEAEQAAIAAAIANVRGGEDASSSPPETGLEEDNTP